MYEIDYKGEKIEYTLIKSKNKNMYIHIKDGKVIVKAPIIYMNHSKDFWNMLQTYMPKYKGYKSQLKEE